MKTEDKIAAIRAEYNRVFTYEEFKEGLRYLLECAEKLEKQNGDALVSTG